MANDIQLQSERSHQMLKALIDGLELELSFLVEISPYSKPKITTMYKKEISERADYKMPYELAYMLFKRHQDIYNSYKQVDLYKHLPKIMEFLNIRRKQAIEAMECSIKDYNHLVEPKKYKRVKYKWKPKLSKYRNNLKKAIKKRMDFIEKLVKKS